MMRETRTLKGLFPDPKPPRRKNFIKENVKSLKRMEQLFHTSDKSAKDLKLPVLRQTKTLSKSNELSHNHITNNDDGLQVLETEVRDYASKNSFHNDQDKRKKSDPVLSKVKLTSKKLSRLSLNGNQTRKSCNNKEPRDCKINYKQRIKYSEGDGITEYEKLNQVASNENPVKCKNQEVQTLDTDDINSLYSEGIIRYPSGRSKETQNLKPDKSETTDLDEAGIKNNSDHSLTENVNYLKLNKDRVTVASRLASQLNNSVPPPSYKVGVVPKYIKERKEILQKEQLAKTTTKHSDCPNGHVPLPDNERKETLSMLKKNYQEFVRELNMLPIKTDTLRSQKRKMEIEQQLTKLEEAIKVFSRPKVFVKVDS